MTRTRKHSRASGNLLAEARMDGTEDFYSVFQGLYGGVRKLMHHEREEIHMKLA